MCLTLKGCTGYLGHPLLHQEHRGVHEEQGRGFSCREGCFSRLFPVADSAKQEARLSTDLVPRVCVRHSLLPCEQGKRKKTCPRLLSGLGHDRGTDRNRRASDYLQDYQRDRQTRSSSSSLQRTTVCLFCSGDRPSRPSRNTQADTRQLHQLLSSSVPPNSSSSNSSSKSGSIRG